MDKVSVIVLSYNNLGGLTHTIQSVYQQDYKNLEVILGDDGSEDYDEDFFDQCENNLLRNENISVLRYHNSENVGTIRNLNKAISMASGCWILPLSSGDTFVERDTVTKIVKCFKEKGAFLVTARRRCMLNGGGYKIKPEDKQVLQIEQGGKELLKAICWDNFISGACTYYKRELFEKVGYFDESMRLLEDTPFYIKCILKGIEIAFLNEVTIDYDMGGVSSEGQVNSILEIDKGIMYQKWIYPNSSLIGKILCRSLEARFYKMTHKNKKIVLFFYYLIHPDTVVYKIYMKMKNQI